MPENHEHCWPRGSGEEIEVPCRGCLGDEFRIRTWNGYVDRVEEEDRRHPAGKGRPRLQRLSYRRVNPPPPSPASTKSATATDRQMPPPPPPPPASKSTSTSTRSATATCPEEEEEVTFLKVVPAPVSVTKMGQQFGVGP
jgi:hypothetical protein